jgi:hypothetical protein
MIEENIFDPKYVESKSTDASHSGSNVKKFLKKPISPEDIIKYGTSKPRRELIKGKTSGR